MNKKFTPKSRKHNLVVQELKGEILIYDLIKNKAFCLNETAAIVWQACDGNQTIDEISEAVGKQLNTRVDQDFVWLAIDQLSRENLIDKETATSHNFNGLSRREAIKKVGLSSAVALPIITGIVAPVAAQTGTCLGGINLPNGEQCKRSCNCASGCCSGAGLTINTCQATPNRCKPF